MSRFGNFSDNGQEFIFTDPKTKRPMLNYIWNSSILSGINQFGGGDGAYGKRASAYIDPNGKGRAVIIRNGNRYFYVRDEETDEIWCPGWYPVKKNLDSYTCTHGLGYSIISGSFGGIEVSVRIIVNSDDPVEIYTIAVKNTTQRERKIKIYSFVEFSLEGYSTYSEYDSYVSSKFLKEHNMIIAFNTAQERPHDWYNGFIASSESISGYESSKNAFLGNYGDITLPKAVSNGKCSNSLAACELMVGVLENTILLNNSGEKTFNVIAGATNCAETAISLKEKLFVKDKIENDFQKLCDSKKDIADSVIIDTPDEKLNNIINYWIKQQIQLCAEAGRATGKGFRDQLQDSWAVVAFNPELAKEKIIETLKHQYSNGSCVRGWLPLDSHIYSDGPTWIAPTINGYIKETGDIDFLNTVVPFLDDSSDTVWEHILIAARYSSEDLGERELVLAHDGDWNDSLNGIGVKGKGESVWTSIALYNALLNTAEMAENILNDKAIKLEMLNRAEKIKNAINKNGWDGEWYLAAYNDEGKKVGTNTEKEGSIYLNSQTWAVMTGVAEGNRAEACLKAIDSKLSSPYGPLTLYPPYTAYNPSIGRLTGFVPGIWENGTPYCHGGTFKIVADCCAGRGDEAYKTLKQIMPDSQENPSEHSGCEPYVFTNMYFGPNNPRAGETSFAWVTGTAGWIFRLVIQYIIGFYPSYNHIEIKPCIPSHWEKLSMKRIYRGDTYNLTIINGGKKNNTIKNITLDGNNIKGNKFDIFNDGNVHQIVAELE